MHEMPHADALTALRSGRRESLDALTQLLYEELREIAHRHGAGDQCDLPGGVSAWPVNAEGGTQSLLWIPAQVALVAGSVLVGDDGGLRVATRLSRVLEGLRPLTSLPIVRVLVPRGEPVRTNGAAALGRAIAEGLSRV